ncbi:MAG: CoB--CoM heterodisulfide reductase iron-sulfur subunit A family protein [Actinobacteria bacterium]|nr:CoB--CoM heterodisulfide reductase iron-sulfur subunit A family protein [Actinomycetota bacterium]
MIGSVLIVGAGPAGMLASAELLNQGFKVILVEEKPTIGGKMAQIDKMFPSNECSTCTILPRMLELTSNPNITIVTFAEVKSIDGKAGDFRAKVVKNPRYVDPIKCTACTDCFPVCPVGGIPMEFNFGRGASKAISFYSPFPPRKALINPEKCTYILEGKCGDKETPPCVEACKPEAIVFNQKPVEVEFNVGAVILATGMDEMKTKSLERFGYRKFSNVLTALEYERLLSGLGPTGGVIKRDDKKEPKSVAWYVLNNPSPVGFMTAVAETMGTIERNPDASVSIFYEDMNLVRDDYNDFYLKAKESKIKFIKIDSVKIAEGKDGNIDIFYDKETFNTEMFVIVPPYAPTENTRSLAEKAGLELDQWGFFSKKSENSHPIYTLKEGIFVCGSAQEPKGIDDAIIQACSAASHAAALLAPSRGKEMTALPEKDILPVKVDDEPAILVVICRCGINISGLLNIDELVNYTASLPYVKHVELTPFGCDGVKVRELLKIKKFNRIVIGACSPKTHEDLFFLHTEMGGLNRYLMEIVNLRNHCTWVHSKNKEKSTEKAKTLMRMGINRAALLESLNDIHVPVTPTCLVIGGTPSGIACALKLGQAGLNVYLVEEEVDLGKIKENDSKFVKNLIDELNKNEKVKIYTRAKVGRIEGFVGNFRAEIVKSSGKKNVNIGCIVVATCIDMRAESENDDFENDLLLQRDEKNFFVGMLGILNPLDFNTDGVFRCGPARKKMGIPDSIIDGEGAASRVAGVISKKELVKSPAISFVVDEYCDGCAYCIDPCPAKAITLIEYMQEDGSIKKTVEVNEAICRGCGVCVATCPKKGIYVKHFKPEYFEEMIKSVMEVS